jgi:hypothetical protein
MADTTYTPLDNPDLTTFDTTLQLVLILHITPEAIQC